MILFLAYFCLHRRKQTYEITMLYLCPLHFPYSEQSLYLACSLMVRITKPLDTGIYTYLQIVYKIFSVSQQLQQWCETLVLCLTNLMYTKFLL